MVSVKGYVTALIVLSSDARILPLNDVKILSSSYARILSLNDVKILSSNDARISPRHMRVSNIIVSTFETSLSAMRD